jgi:chemotaxis protein methyltransferase CheR
VLGTDISETAITRARELCFTSEQMQRVHPQLRDRWFVPAGPGRFTLAGPLKERASFLCHNLMDTPYPTAAEGQGFDLIACRNVLIYFGPESFAQVVSSLAGRLAPEGMLMLSAAEPLLQTPPSLRTVRCDHAFFYARAQAGASASGTAVLGAVKAPSYSGLPAVGSDRATRPAEPPVAASPLVPAPEEPGSHSEADALFAQVLGGAAGSEVGPETAETLRRCLSLDPDLAAARYLLGMLLEQRGTLAEAAVEYRRALRSLEEGRVRATPFFLNNARLQVACARAIERVERAPGSSSPR